MHRREFHIRCFDLGGSGLKTCFYPAGQDQPQGIYNLGVSPHDHIALWLRQRILTLDSEIEAGVIFSFSLAGLDKLSESRRLPNQREAKFIAYLCGLPVAQVLTLNDGDAHLLAARVTLGIQQFPQINFTVGSGVGIGMYDDQGQSVSEIELLRMLGKNIWDLDTKSQASIKKAWFALGHAGYDELRRQDQKNATLRFEARWLRFLTSQLFNILEKTPQTVTFTGGIVDQDAQLFTAVVPGLEYQIIRGPRYAGLIGSKCHAEQTLA